MPRLKIRQRKKPVPEWNSDLRRLIGIAWLLYSFFSQCTRYAQNYSSFLNLQDMCNIIQVNVNISNTHSRWKSIWVIEDNTSVSQVGGKLQIVQVGEGFELNCSGDIEVQLYFCRSKVLTQDSTRCAEDCTSFLNVQDVSKIVLFSSVWPILPNLPCFKYESFQLIWLIIAVL